VGRLSVWHAPNYDLGDVGYFLQRYKKELTKLIITPDIPYSRLFSLLDFEAARASAK
jgi:hypothetical protein